MLDHAGLTGVVVNTANKLQGLEFDVVVCWRARNRGSGGRPWAKTSWRVEGDGQFFLPFGLVRPVDQIAMVARRYAYEYGSPPEMLGAVAVACRKHAKHNPYALMREPMSMDDYLRIRMVSDPLRLFDCCLETDGALAIVVTSAARARDLKQRPAYILAGAQGTGPQCVVMANYHKPVFLETPSPYCARELFGRAGITPQDVDVAQIYDAFTPLVVLSLEEYGFCGKGEAKDFVKDGALEWPNGRLPVNVKLPMSTSKPSGVICTWPRYSALLISLRFMARLAASLTR